MNDGDGAAENIVISLRWFFAGILLFAFNNVISFNNDADNINWTLTNKMKNISYEKDDARKKLQRNYC